MLLVRTKVDRAPGVQPGRDGDEVRVTVAARSGEGDLRERGLGALREAMLDAGFGGRRAADEAPLLTRRRQARSVRRARDHVREFRESRTAGAPAEIAVTHLQDAQLALEDLLGIVETEQVLDALFSRFCVGK